MLVKDVMNDEVFLIQDTEQVAYARKIMLKHGVSRVIVTDRDGNPIGIVTEKDLTRQLKGNGPACGTRAPTYLSDEEENFDIIIKSFKIQ